MSQGRAIRANRAAGILIALLLAPLLAGCQTLAPSQACSISPSSLEKTAPGAITPHISSSWIVWQQHYRDTGENDVLAMPTAGGGIVTIAGGPALQTGPYLADSRVVFREELDGRVSIHLHDLDASKDQVLALPEGDWAVRAFSGNWMLLELFGSPDAGLYGLNLAAMQPVLLTKHYLGTAAMDGDTAVWLEGNARFDHNLTLIVQHLSTGNRQAFSLQHASLWPDVQAGTVVLVMAPVDKGGTPSFLAKLDLVDGKWTNVTAPFNPGSVEHPAISGSNVAYTEDTLATYGIRVVVRSLDGNELLRVNDTGIHPDILGRAVVYETAYGLRGSCF